MNNIGIVIPVIDETVQDFSNLISDLCGNYQPKPHIEISYEEGEEVETVIENPYSSMQCPNFSGKIVLVSHSPLTPLDGTISVLVDGELNISKLWNAGINYASSNGYSHVVILNQVSSINPHIFEEAVSEVDSAVINISDGGCFIVTPGVVANENYRWWFADVDLFENNETTIYRKDFIDIFQENIIPIEGEMQSVVDADIATRTQQ